MFITLQNMGDKKPIGKESDEQAIPHKIKKQIIR